MRHLLSFFVCGLAAFLGVSAAPFTPSAQAAVLDTVFLVAGDNAASSTGYSDEIAFVQNALQTILPSSGSAGVLLYATGVYDTEGLTPLANGGAASVGATIGGWTYPSGMNYQKTAISTAISMLSTTPSDDARLIVDLIAANPNPSTQSACTLYPSLDANHISVIYIVGGSNVTLTKIDCLVQSSADILSTSSFAGLPTLDSSFQALVNQVAPVPEPGSVGLLAMSVVGAICLRGRRCWSPRRCQSYALTQRKAPRDRLHGARRHAGTVPREFSQGSVVAFIDHLISPVIGDDENDLPV